MDKNKKAKQKSCVWKYFHQQQDSENNKLYAICKYCSNKMLSNATKCRNHIIYKCKSMIDNKIKQKLKTEIKAPHKVTNPWNKETQSEGI